MIRPYRERQPDARRRDVWLVASLLMLAVALPLAAGAVAGSLEIPRNDDWSYRRIAIGLAESGRFVLDGISETMIVGQILLTQPLLWVSGLQPWAFTVAGVVFGVGGILSAYALARSVLPARETALAAALLAGFPGYLAYATSFMSDVPTLTAEYLCLALGAMAIRRRPAQVGWLCASMALGILAFSIREFAIAAPASVLFAAIAMEPRRLRLWGLAIGVAACCFAIHLWRGSLPGQLPPVPPGYGSFSQSTQALSSVAFAIAPAALIGAIRWRRHIRLFDVLIGLELAGILVVARLIQWVTEGAMPPIVLDNLASQWGVPAREYLVGGRPLLFADAPWAFVNGLALIATAVVLSVGSGIAGTHLRRSGRSSRALLSRLGSPVGILVLFSLAMTGGLVLFGLTHPLFDRYFWPVVLPLAALFLYLPADLKTLPRRPRRRSEPLLDVAIATSATLLTIALAIVSLTYLFNSHAFDAARWEAGQRLVDSGIPPDRIDAGYEWVGYHATSQGDPTNRTSRATIYGSWWSAFVPCGVVSSDTSAVPPGSRLVGTTTYDLYLVGGPVATLYLYRIMSPACP